MSVSPSYTRQSPRPTFLPAEPTPPTILAPGPASLRFQRTGDVLPVAVETAAVVGRHHPAKRLHYVSPTYGHWVRSVLFANAVRESPVGFYTDRCHLAFVQRALLYRTVAKQFDLLRPAARYRPPDHTPRSPPSDFLCGTVHLPSAPALPD